jgi:hypothetical protein
MIRGSTFLRTYEQQPTECSICFDQYPLDSTNANKDIVITECGHNYHSACLRETLQYGEKCPLCRRDINVIYVTNPKIEKITSKNTNLYGVEFIKHLVFEQKTQSKLIFCCTHGNISLLKNLLQNNENILQAYDANKDNKCLISMARENGHSDIIKVLREYDYGLQDHLTKRKICIIPEFIDLLPSDLEEDFLCKKYAGYLKDIIISYFEKSTIMHHAEYTPYSDSSVDIDESNTDDFYLKFSVFFGEGKRLHDVIINFKEINTGKNIIYCLNNLIVELRGYMCIIAIVKKYIPTIEGDISLDIDIKKNSYLKNYISLECFASEKLEFILVKFLDFFDARTKCVDWDNMKEQIGELNMKKLFSIQHHDDIKDYDSVVYPTGIEDFSDSIA